MARSLSHIPSRPSLIVVCLEGCHGVGKTQLVKLFEKAGIEILDEGFLSMKSRLLHPQSLLMETAWVSACFQRIVERAETSKEAKPTVVISDRSPYSACFYAQNGGALLEPIIDEHVRELTMVGVKVITLCVDVEPNMLWERIQARLAIEPHRAVLHEDRREWMEQTLSFYQSKDRNWDGAIDNSGDIGSAAFACVSEVARVSSEAGFALADRLSTVCDLPRVPAMMERTRKEQADIAIPVAAQGGSSALDAVADGPSDSKPSSIQAPGSPLPDIKALAPLPAHSAPGGSPGEARARKSCKGTRIRRPGGERRNVLTFSAVEGL